ncbi:unnamed protein product [Sphenostylis stenocarpa]|uniref:DUF7815 domain-containing protein n=1 Tax=Sphenostylis stenocarpa TaxID=92480 RepID=A0AA86SDD6_9FABA|nr:unnamed protein product [Sphenostylis stenocarpa]
MAFEMPLDQIKQLRILLRKEANLSWYEPEKEENLALPKLPSVSETIAKLDPSPSYLRCKNCDGRLIRDVQSFVCVFCGTNSRKDLPPEPIKFKSTIGYRWLLESLQLDGSEMVTPVIDENEWNRGRNESKDEIPLSELLDLEIRWPSEAEIAQSSSSASAAFQGKSSLSLAGVDLDSYFNRKESNSDVFQPNMASGRQVGTASDNTFQANENLSLFQNVQASEVAAGSAENLSGDSFSGWEARFTSASSDPVHEMSKSVDHSEVDLDTASGFWKDPVGVKKNDDFNPSASTEHDYFQGDGWRTSNSMLQTQTGKSESTMDLSGTKTVESANGSSRDVDWMQSDQWQGSGNKTTDNVGITEDNSLDEWNDFTGSASTEDPSSTISSLKTTDQTGSIGFSVDFTDTKIAEDANSSSNKDFDWMQYQWQDSNNESTDTISANEAVDSFDSWNDFTGSANTQHSSFGVSHSEITSQTGKFESTQDHNDTKTAESAAGSSNFDWMQDDGWQGIENKVTGIVTTNEVADTFDAWNDFTGSAILHNPASVVSDSLITAQMGNSEITADLNDLKTERDTNAFSHTSFDWNQNNQWQDSNNKTTDSRTTNDIDSFDDWNDFTSLATTQDHSSSVWKQTVNQTSAEKTSEMNLPSTSIRPHDIEFSGLPQHDLFPGQFGSFSASLPATASNRVAEVDTTRGNSGDVPTAVGSKDDVEMLMSQMHDLSFMLENNLSIPPK